MITCGIASSGEEVFLSPVEQQILKQRLALIILHQHKWGCRDFYVNCNYGVPLWAAEIICKFKKYMHINLHISAPHEEQSSYWEEQHRDRYMRVHQMADTIAFVSFPHDPDSYQCADEFMVNKSTYLLMYGDPDSGTYVEEYAKDIGKIIEHI